MIVLEAGPLGLDPKGRALRNGFKGEKAIYAPGSGLSLDTDSAGVWIWGFRPLYSCPLFKDRPIYGVSL